MSYNFCTLFDKNFLIHGIALYRSVVANCPEPLRFWILAMDNETYDILAALDLPNVTLIRLEEFEDEELKRVKGTRSRVEYFWTLSPSLPSYILRENPSLETITYLDADLFFYSSIVPLYENFGTHSVMLIPHRIHGKDARAREERSGKYNVGMLVFRNDEDGRACLEWWRQKCNEWCYDKVEPTRYGDQKYLDYFEEKFKNVCILPGNGAGLSRWNIGAYKGKVRRDEGAVYLGEEKLVFFHFSQFRLYYPPSSWLPWGPPSLYTVPGVERELIYGPYSEALYRAVEDVRAIQPDFLGGTLPRPSWFRQSIEIILYMAKTSLKRVLGR